MQLAHVVGKWCNETCEEFYEKIKQRVRAPTRKHKLKIVSDGNDQNEQSILKHFDKKCVEYGQVVKKRENQIVISVGTRKVIGRMKKSKITMRKIDSYCGTLRERIPIFVRETKAFSKKRKNVENRLDIFQVYRNFIWKRKGKTPAMKERITDKPWDWNKILKRRF